MKRIFAAVLALACFASCNKAEIIEQTAPVAISFENPFIENATLTRSEYDPSTTTATLQNFTVYAFMDQPSGVVFNQEPVRRNGEKWNTATTQYWFTGHEYHFAALAGNGWSVDTKDATTNGAAGSVTFTNTNGKDDLLYAWASVSTKNITEITATNPGPVNFTFNHLLSKVKFAFTNAFTNPSTSVVVKNIQMTVPKQGTINLGMENWMEGDNWNTTSENITLNFGDVVVPIYPDTKNAESYNELLTIPTGEGEKEYTYDITFTVELYQGGIIAGTYDHTVAVKGVKLEMGHAYKFKTELSGSNINPDAALQPITFSVSSIKGWEEENDQNIK